MATAGSNAVVCSSQASHSDEDSVDNAKRSNFAHHDDDDDDDDDNVSNDDKERLSKRQRRLCPNCDEREPEEGCLGRCRQCLRAVSWVGSLLLKGMPDANIAMMDRSNEPDDNDDNKEEEEEEEEEGEDADDDDDDDDDERETNNN